MNFAKLLKPFYKGKNERVGFVLDDGSAVECVNISETPESSFAVDPAEIVLWADQAIATWHTHPGQSSNLSMDDYETFMTWKDLKHIILGKGSISIYYIDEHGELLLE